MSNREEEPEYLRKIQKQKKYIYECELAYTPENFGYEKTTNFCEFPYKKCGNHYEYRDLKTGKCYCYVHAIILHWDSEKPYEDSIRKLYDDFHKHKPPTGYSTDS